jgi:hypothetical protein
LLEQRSYSGATHFVSKECQEGEAIKNKERGVVGH